MICNRSHKFVLVLALVTVCFLCTPAHAQQAAIDNGLVYLRAAQNLDGSWGGTATSLNTVLQTTATAARTLQLLGASDGSLTNAINFIASQTPDTVDDLAQQLEVLTAAGAEMSGLIASIKLAQHEDGGWGIDPDKTFQSEVVDTLSAIRALRTALAADATTASHALGYLLSVQNTDGGWGAAQGQPSELFYTAFSLLALKDYQTTFNLNTSIVSASNYLVGQQNTDGSFGSPTGTAFETSLALQAMLRFVVDPAKRSNAVNDLVSTQTANGSWADDAYSTALAIRALKESQTVDLDIDNDGDGFTERQGDCDDTNPAIHPGALDLTVNGIDENCDGIDGLPIGDVDADGDGFTVAQGDCNDADPAIHPGAVDIPNNSIDEDCNGQDAVRPAIIESMTLFKSVDSQRTPTSTFNAYEILAAVVTLTDPSVQLGLFVIGPFGEILEVSQGIGEFLFETLNNAPGVYSMVARASDPTSDVLLDERSVIFSIQPTVAIADAATVITPSFTHVGATETMTLSLTFTNRSNVAAIFTVEYTVTSPSGVVLSTGSVDLSTGEAAPIIRADLVSLTHTFTESGNYTIQVRVFHNTEVLAMPTQTFSVAPTIRMEPRKTLTPDTVLPDGDKRIRIDIRLEGVEQ